MRKITISIFLWPPTSNQRVRSLEPTAPPVTRKDSPNAHSLSSTKTGLSPGATAPRSWSILAQTEYCRHWKNWKNRRPGMTKLAVAVSDKDHRQGDKDAPCTLVEYGDYQCPSCGQAYPIVKRVQKHFGKRLLFVFRNFPLSQMHVHAESAAETAEFAGAH